MTTWLDPGRAWNSTHEYLDTSTLGALINNYCYGKSQVRITRDFLFVDLRKELNSITSRFLLVSCRYLYITIHDATKSRIICLTYTEGLFPSNSKFLMKRHSKRLRGQTINKTVTNPNYTKPKRTKTVIWNWAELSHYPSTIKGFWEWRFDASFVCFVELSYASHAYGINAITNIFRDFLNKMLVFCWLVHQKEIWKRNVTITCVILWTKCVFMGRHAATLLVKLTVSLTQFG